MKIFSFGSLAKITILAIILFVFSGFVSREKIFISTYSNATGGGGAFVAVKEGFPINYITDLYGANYIDNPNYTAGYSVVWTKFLLNSIIWLFVSALICSLYRRLVIKK